MTCADVYLFSAKGAMSPQPGASPQASNNICDRALKARLNEHGDDNGLRLRNESRFQRPALARTIFLERCSRLTMKTAPLALTQRCHRTQNSDMPPQFERE